MSLIVQTGEQSLRSVSACAPSTSIEVPPAVERGDVLVVLVSVMDLGNAIDPTLSDPGWEVVDLDTLEGTMRAFWRPVPTIAEAQRLKGLGTMLVDLNTELNLCTNVFIFRVSGADQIRFIESTQPSIGDVEQDGHITIPSLDPEYRKDNALLFFASMEFDKSAPIPLMTITRAAPIGTVVSTPASEEQSEALTSSLFVRNLINAEHSGESVVAVSAEPFGAFAAAIMIRSANTPPVIFLPENWAAEVGKKVSVSATVTDVDDTPVSFAWSQVSGPEAVQIENVYSRAFSFTPSEAGVYVFSLSATDVDGGRASATTRVIVPTGKSGPTSVVASTGWLDQHDDPVTDPELFQDAHDETFARTVDVPVGDPLTVALPPIYGSAAVTVVVRGAATNPSPIIHRNIRLHQSDGTLIAERHFELTTNMDAYVFTTTKEETAYITNRAGLMLTIEDFVGGA